MNISNERNDVDISNDKNEGYVKYKIDQELAAQKKVRTIRIQGNQAQNLVRQIHSLYRSRIKHLLYVKDQKDDIIVSFYDSICLSQLIPLFEQFSGIQIKQCPLNKVRDTTKFNLSLSDSDSNFSNSSQLQQQQSSLSSISQNIENDIKIEEDSSDHKSLNRHSQIKKMSPLKQKKCKLPDEEELFDKKRQFFNSIELVVKQSDIISIKDVFQYLQCKSKWVDEPLNTMLNEECQKVIQCLWNLKKIFSNEDNSLNFKNSAPSFSNSNNNNHIKQ